MALSLHGVSRWNTVAAGLFAALFLASFAGAQTQANAPIYGGHPTSQESGSATGGVFAPVLDSEKRPITAGGFVKTGPVVFADVSQKAGLTSNDQRLHFGLGHASNVDAVEIRWPSGSVEQVSLPSLDRFFAIEEGKRLVSSVCDTITGNTSGAHSRQHAAK